MEHYRKLVRDRIPAILDEKGVSYEKHIADESEYRIELIKKLSEETQEFQEAGSIDELADVLEVIDALRQLPEYESVDEVKAKKREERGGFQDRTILSGEK